MGQTGRVLLKEAAAGEEGAGRAEAAGGDDDDVGDVVPLWGQREDRQVQVSWGEEELPFGCTRG